ncbi:MAG: hypothetical protein PHU42_04265 [Patescibacteria group bacterium]|nr:hypothetical protein [Patescibacteria group bacterium]
MKIKGFLLTSEVLTIIVWAVFFAIIVFIDPYKSATSIFILFFALLFLALAGSWGLLEFYLVTKYKGFEEIRNRTFNAFRHGIMFSAVATGLLFMKGADVLSVWDGVIFMLAIILFEAYFMTRGTILNENKSN